MEDVRNWLSNNGSGDGSGSGSGDGYGYGSGRGRGRGSGSGSGDGYGSGRGRGSGYGSGSGDGYGYGSGDGSGRGRGYGYGSGDGSGSGDGYDIQTFNDQDVYRIDGVPTIIEHIRGAVAKGYILYEDFTLKPCYVVKGNGYFAHGETLREARSALQEKIFEDMDSDETIEKFIEKFSLDKQYPGTEFFEWHHYLTGSCRMGRESFVKNKGLDINAMYTVKEFISLCENDYGGEIIKQLKEKLNIE